MSNSESFIEEVTEEVRRDRLFLAFRKYGWIAGLMVVGIVGGAIYTEWQKTAKSTADKAFGDTLLSALEQDTPESRRSAIAAAETAANGAADKLAIQKLMLASDPNQKDTEGGSAQSKAISLAALDAVAADPDVTPLYRDLAVLRRVILAGTEMDVASRRAALDPLAAAGRPFRPLALEQLAYLDAESGDIDEAITKLRSLSQDQEAPAGLRQRVKQMILALGGEETAEG